MSPAPVVAARSTRSAVGSRSGEVLRKGGKLELKSLHPQSCL